MSNQRPSIEKPICSTIVLWKGSGLVRATQSEQVDQSPDPFEVPNTDIWKRTSLKTAYLWCFNSRFGTHGSIAPTLLSP